MSERTAGGKERTVHTCQKSMAETAFWVFGPGAAMPIVIAVGTQPSSKITNWIIGSFGSQPFA